MTHFLRRTVVVLVLFALSAALALRTARAELERALLAGTQGMFALPPAWFHGAPRRVQVNGASVRITSGRSELALSALLDLAETMCARHAGGLSQLVAAAQRKVRHQLLQLPASTLRAENVQQGVLACLDLGSSRLSATELAHKLERFSETLDLAELGGVRMVRAQALEHGTFFVVAESQGSVPLARMFPATGDAPGLDSVEHPRPRGTRRLLSAWQEDQEPALFVYESPRSADALWAEYTRDLEARGWKPSSAEHAHSASQHGELFARAGHALLVVVSPGAQGAQALVMPLDAGPGSIAIR